MTQKTNKLTFIDLFAGCGGLSEGFLQSGRYEALAHVEWELPMVNTLRYRLSKKYGHSEENALSRVIHFDIQKTFELLYGNWDEESIKDYGKSNNERVISKGLTGLIGDSNVDLIIGGPPCQAYSIAGRAQDKHSMKFDYRNYLFESFVEVVKTIKPPIFIFENVPGILSAKPGDKFVTERIYEAFDKAGYEVRSPVLMKRAVFDAFEFNVPQKRRRILIIGVLKTSGLNLEKIYQVINDNRSYSQKKTVQDFISHLPKFAPVNDPSKINGRNVSHRQISGYTVMHHEPRFHNQRDIEIFRNWILNSMNKKSSEEKISFYNNLMSRKSNHGKYRNLEWEEPSPTIVAHLYKDGLMFIHPDPEQARSITVKEASLLQTFPDDFDFLGSTGDQFKMIGNAVPVEMARRIAEGVADYLTER